MKRRNKKQSERELLLDLQARASVLRDSWNDTTHAKNISGSESIELEKLINEAKNLNVGATRPRSQPSFLVNPILWQQGRIYDLKEAKTAVEMICRRVENKIKIMDDKVRNQRNIFLYLWLYTLISAVIYAFLSKYSVKLSKSCLNILKSILNIIIKSGWLPLLIAERKNIIRWVKKSRRREE